MDHRYDFAEQLQALNTSVGFHVGNLRRDIGDIKRFNISLDRRFRSQRSQSSGLCGREKVVKHMLLRLCGDGGDFEAVYRERFKSAVNPATTSVPEWAGLLSANDIRDFLLAGATPSLLARLLTLGVDVGTGWPLPLLFRNAGGPLGAWVAEAGVGPVGSISLAAFTPVIRKILGFAAFSRELRKHSNPSIERILDSVMRQSLNEVIDTALVDNLPSDAARPAGLLNNVTPTPPGADPVATMKALASVLLDNGATSVVFLANPLLSFDLASVPGALDIALLTSPYVPANRLIAVDPGGFAGAIASAELTTSEDATLHLDTVAQPIVDGTGVAATPVTSLWQQARIDMSALVDAGWGLKPGSVAYSDQA
jgi:hypothetical protein